MLMLVSLLCGGMVSCLMLFCLMFCVLFWVLCGVILMCVGCVVWLMWMFWWLFSISCLKFCGCCLSWVDDCCIVFVWCFVLRGLIRFRCFLSVILMWFCRFCWVICC